MCKKLIWPIYWVIVLLFYAWVSYRWKSFTVFMLIPGIAFLFFAVRVVLGFCIRPFKKKKILYRCAAVGATVIALLVTGYAVSNMILNGTRYNERVISRFDYSGLTSNTEVSYDYETGVYSVRATKDELRILQLTDIHIGSSYATIGTDKKAFTACYDIIMKAKPDLIIVTGDISFATVQTFSRNNLKTFYHFAEFMNRFGIPWTLAYGNHDTEFIAMYDSNSHEGLFDALMQYGNCPMIYPKIQPTLDFGHQIYGRNNQLIRLENKDGSLNHLLFVIDTNDYVGGVNIQEYDSIHNDQLVWYENTIKQYEEAEGHLVKSFVYMHIPVEEFADAYGALINGNPDAKYLFGSNLEKVSHPQRNSHFFDLVKKLKSTQAIFVGHDHFNNIGINYQGVDLVYGKSIDYIAYAGIEAKKGHRGGTLVRLKENGEYVIEQIDYDK